MRKVQLLVVLALLAGAAAGATAAGTITTVAGTGESGFSGDGGPATLAKINDSEGIAVDAAGNLFIADQHNYRVRRVDAVTQVITTVAGDGSFTLDLRGDGGPATSAPLSRIKNVAVDAAGNLFVCDTDLHRVRRVDAQTRTITTFAGNGDGSRFFYGDGGPATAAIVDPEAVAFDGTGNVFIADGGHHAIRQVAPDGIITTVAGIGGPDARGFRGDGGPATAAMLNGPRGLAVDRHGNLFIADTGNGRIRRVDAQTRVITTFATVGCMRLALDAAGNLYCTDQANHVVRKVDANGVVSTFAGNGVVDGTSSGDGGPATAARIYNPTGIAVDAAGHVYVATMNGGYGVGSSRVRRVSAGDTAPPAVTIRSPLPDSVVSREEIGVVVEVQDDSGTTVTSTPAGVAGATPPGGGQVSGVVPLESEGPNTISVHATDAGGRMGGTAVEVIRDTTSPSVEVLSPAPGSVVGASPVTVSVRVTDLTATQVDVGGTVLPVPAGGGDVSAAVDLVPGANAVPVVATDAAGWQTSVPVALTLDLSAPLVQVLSPLDGAMFGPGESPVVVTASVDDVSATTVRSDPPGLSEDLPAGGGIVVGSLDLLEGSNRLTVEAADEFGRRSSHSVQVVLDTTAPDVSFTYPLSGYAVRGTIELHASASDPLPGSGVARVEFFVDGAAVGTLLDARFGMVLDTAALPDGPHRVRARAFDGKGNARDAEIMVTVDNTAPNVTILEPRDGSVLRGTVPFSTQLFDGTSGIASVRMKVGGDVVHAAYPFIESYLESLPVDTTRWPDGPLSLDVTAGDMAGNEATVSVTIVVDNTGPDQVVILSPADGATLAGEIPIEASATDDRLASLAILVDGVQVASTGQPRLSIVFESRTRLDGPMRIEARATDRAGNTGSRSVTVTVDNVRFGLAPGFIDLGDLHGRDGLVRAHVSGGSLLLYQGRVTELRVPGGNPVRSEDGTPLAFSKRALAASIQAGIDGGAIPVGSSGNGNETILIEVTLVADGLVQGAAPMRVMRRR
jgi:sugar lactone lactonase YvrE